MPSTGRSRWRSLIQLRYASSGARLSSEASLWLCRSRVVATYTTSLPRRAKLEQRHFGRGVLEHGLDGHSYFNLIGLALHKVGQQLKSLVEFDVGHQVGQRFAKAWRLVLHGRRESVDRTCASASHPLSARA